jgi:TonB-linked SusC/RagA family outer membrane protein
MEVQPIGLEGVIVTAMGVVREKRELPYSAQNVTAEKLTTVPQTNVVSALSGNVSGVNIISSATPGGTARIVIRGHKSISGNNQPLFVVDGTPIDNPNYGANGFGGKDRGDGVQDIDPYTIESITVLKGPNAAAIYGSRAANGAVLITTKSGKTAQGIGITATTGMTFESPLRLPSYQNKYGQGFKGDFRYVDGTGEAPGNINDGADESWGPRLDGRLIDQFTGPQQPWVAHPNNVRDFFELGRQAFVNASFSRAGERTDLRLSVTNSNHNTMAPGNKFVDTKVQLRGGVELTDRLSAGASVNYTRRDADNRVGTGYGGDNFMQQTIWFGRQVDMKALKAQRLREDGTQFNWNANYHDNPYFIQLVNKNWDSRDRVFGNVDLTYRATDWLTAMVRVGQDQMTNFTKSTYAVDTRDWVDGAFAEGLASRLERNVEFMLTGTRELNPDLQLTMTMGGNQRVSEDKANSVSVGKLGVPGIYSLQNAGETPAATSAYSKKQVNSLLGSATVSYKGFWSVDLTGRNDWSSTLPKENASYFYPSVSSALIFTDALGIESSLLSSGKIRASWARVGNDTDPYRLLSTYTAGSPFNTIPAYNVPGTMLNPFLKPEETTSVEFGTDLGFFNERLGFVLTHYDSKTRDQILSVQTSASSGFTAANINAGEVRNWGWELQMNATPIRASNGFNWDVTVNFDKNNNEVTKLYGDMEAQNMTLGNRNNYWSMNVQARKGHPYGVLFGNGFARNDQKQILVDADGIPLIDSQKRILGNYNPDWKAGITNRLSYGPLDFSFMFDGQYGGSLFSTTIWFGNYAGVLDSSLRGREVDWNNPKIKVDGVYAQGEKRDILDGDGNKIGEEDLSGKENTSWVTAEEYFHSTFGNHEVGIYDASFIKLREMSLSYRVPASFVNRLGFSSMNVAVVGKNLWMTSKIPHVDPETTFTSGNMQGIEFGQFPTARSIGFTVSVKP